MTQIWNDRSNIGSRFVLLGTAQVTLIAAITLIVVPLPAIQRQFDLSATELALLSAAYGLPFGGLLLVGGRLADRLGARRVFLAGMWVFGGSSLLAGLAPVHVMLLGARFTQGVGAALIAPAAVAMISQLFPVGQARSRALAIWGTLGASGAFGGTVLSGLVSAVGSWRWAFLLPAAIAAVTLVGAARLPATRLPAGGGQVASRLAIADGVLVTVGLVALSYGVLETMPTVIVAAVLVLAVFLARQARVVQPLLPLGLIAHRTRAAALLVIWLTAAASATGTFLLSLFFQQIQHRTPTMTSAAFLPLLLVIAMGPVSGRLVQRIGTRSVTVAGLTVAAASMFLLSRVDMSSPYVGVVLAGMLLFPIGAGLAFAGATVSALTDVPPERSGVAGGLVNTAIEVGPTVGLALALALATARTETLRSQGLAAAPATAGGYAAALAAIAAAFVVTAIVVTLTSKKKGHTQ